MYDGDAPLAERRARRADPRPRPAPRAARPGGAARAARPGRARRPRAEPPGARPTSATRRPLDQVHDLLRRLGDLSPDEVGRADRRRARRGADPGWPSWRRRAARSRARIAGEERWIAIEDVARYRDGVGRERRRPACPQAFLGPVVGRARRAARPLGPDARAVPRRRSPRAAGACRPGVVEDALERLRRAPARCCAASSGPAAPSASGATPRCCACSAAGRSPGCGARSSRSTRRRSPGSCPPGRASRPSASGVAGRRSAARPRSSASPRSSTSSPACRSRRRSWSATSCRRASPATSRGCSTSSARWARSPGWGGGASAATTGGSSSSGRAASCSGRPACRTASSGPTGELPRARSASTSARRGASFYRELFAARRRRLGPRGPRRAVGPGLGRRGHQRHVRAAAGAALEAAGERTHRPRPGPADRRSGRPRRPAAGRSSTARRDDGADRGEATPTAPTRTERVHAQALALLERHGVADPRGRRRRGRRRRVQRASTRSCGRWRRPAGSGAATSSTGSGRPSSRCRARSTGCGRCATSRASSPASTDGSSTSSRRPTRPTRTAPRSRGRAAARRTGGRSSAPPAPTWCSSTASRRSTSTAAAPRSRRCPRPTTRPSPRPRPGRSAALVGDGRVRELVVAQGRRRARRRVAVPRRAARRPGSSPAIAASSCRRRRAPSASPTPIDADARGRHALPDRGRAAAVPRRADGHRGPGAAPARAAGRAHRRRDDHRGRGARQEPPDPVRQRPRDPDPPADERLVAPLPARRALAPAAGPGAPRPRGPGRGRGLLRRAGRRAVRAAGRGAPSAARAARAGPARATRSTPTRRVRRLRDPSRAATDDRRGARSTSGRSPASATSTRARSCSSSASSPFAPSPTSTTPTLDRLVATARRLLRANAPPGARRRARHDEDRDARPPTARCGSIGRCRPAVPPLRDADPVDDPGRELPRITYWCPRCQPDAEGASAVRA